MKNEDPNPKPTTVDRLNELVARMEIMTTDGDTRQLTQDDIGDIYQWLLYELTRESHE